MTRFLIATIVPMTLLLSGPALAQRAADPVIAWEALPEDPTLREACAPTLNYSRMIAGFKDGGSSLTTIMRWAEQEAERSGLNQPPDLLIPIGTQLILINLIDQAYLGSSIYKRIPGGFPQWAYRSCLKGHPIDGTGGD